MKTVRFGDIVGSYYQSEKPNGALMIVAIGAPNLVDVDSLRNAEILMDAGYDIITPEYYGFCRSGRDFTPMNSIQTLLDTKNVFSGGEVTDVYSGENITVGYERFVFLGLSYGGGVVPLLSRFDPSIDIIGVFYPVTEYASFGKCGVKEETVEDFLGAINRGFVSQYRGIDSPVWKSHFQDQEGLSPLYNLDYLENVRVFLAHGTRDESIYYKKTQKYYKALKEKFPTNSIVYQEYTGKGHGPETMMPATQDFIEWLRTTAL